ncbi:MAG: hypothetical protein NTW86_16830, partial [Candidatus Sumerlaeota bacterium]|nr:hypothetical protein [Candidatus Sumerlaeota bacterium]
QPGDPVALYNLEPEIYAFYGEYRPVKIEGRTSLAKFFAEAAPRYALMRSTDFEKTFKKQINEQPLYAVAKTYLSERPVVCVTNVAPGKGAAALIGE